MESRFHPLGLEYRIVSSFANRIVLLLTNALSFSDTTRAAEEICQAIEIGYRQIDLAWKYNVSPPLAMPKRALIEIQS